MRLTEAPVSTSMSNSTPFTHTLTTMGGDFSPWFFRWEVTVCITSSSSPLSEDVSSSSSSRWCTFFLSFPASACCSRLLHTRAMCPLCPFLWQALQYLSLNRHLLATCPSLRQAVPGFLAPPDELALSWLWQVSGGSSSHVSWHRTSRHLELSRLLTCMSVRVHPKASYGWRHRWFPKLFGLSERFI